MENFVSCLSIISFFLVGNLLFLSPRSRLSSGGSGSSGLVPSSGFSGRCTPVRIGFIPSRLSSGSPASLSFSLKTLHEMEMMNYGLSFSSFVFLLFFGISVEKQVNHNVPRLSSEIKSEMMR